jgi:hypothetical protein
MSRPYSFLRHLGRAIFFGDFRDSFYMAMFTAYFDASGNKRMPVLTVAGFVSRVAKWDRFNDEWSAILSGEQVSSMHMTDFVSSKRQFASWRGQSDRRRKFISDLTDCIKRNTNKGFAASLFIDDYNEVNAEFKVSEHFGQPFTLCSRTCLGALKVWADKKKVKPEHLLVFIEQGDDDQGEFQRFAREDGFKVIPLEKKDAQAFQAGDVAGWKSRTVLHNAAFAPVADREEAEKIVRSLDPIRPIIQANQGFDKANLLRLCNKAGIPRRTPEGMR